MVNSKTEATTGASANLNGMKFETNGNEKVTTYSVVSEIGVYDNPKGEEEKIIGNDFITISTYPTIVPIEETLSIATEEQNDLQQKGSNVDPMQKKDSQDKGE